MGFKDWFQRNKPSAPSEISPGGSKFIRHGEKERRMPGITSFSTLPFIEKRESVYRGMFGEYALVYDDEFPGLVPHIDVYVHEPGFNGRPFYTLVTGGMSDLPMTLPNDAPPSAPRRAEIVFYLPANSAPAREYISFLRTAARFVYEYQTALGFGHTIPNGQPPTPIFEGLEFTAILFLYPLFEPDNQLPKQLLLENDPVHLLWIVPLTPAEHRLKLERGTNALLDLFEQMRHPFVFDRVRRSYV